jgi:predicted DNA-binding transcriptional regulator AlpA
MDKDLLNEQDLAKMLKVRRETVQSWRLRGEGPKFIKVSGAVRYDRADVDSYLKEHKRQSTKDSKVPKKKKKQYGMKWERE